jgi:hypothetical protein
LKFCTCVPGVAPGISSLGVAPGSEDADRGASGEDENKGKIAESTIQRRGRATDELGASIIAGTPGKPKPSMVDGVGPGVRYRYRCVLAR